MLPTQCACEEKEGNLKTLLTFAICLAIATPTFCQSKSALTDKQAKEYQLRIALEQIRVAIDHYHAMANLGKVPGFCWKRL